MGGFRDAGEDGTSEALLTTRGCRSDGGGLLHGTPTPLREHELVSLDL